MRHDRPMDHSSPDADVALCFCADTECVLHVQRGDSHVDGWGDWAVRPDGIVTGRAFYDGEVLCDLCGRRRRTGTTNRASVA
jgi:hypothetical protein